MAKGVNQEGYFWDTYPWVMSCNSSGTGNGEDGNEERSLGDKRHSQMKQRQMGYVLDGSGGGKQALAATTVDGDSKKNSATFEIKKVIKTDDHTHDIKVSLHDHNAKNELVPSDHDLHIWTERERRKKMRNMFHQLHALMPQLPHKADKSAIVDEAVNYIKALQQNLQMLETKKLEKLYGPFTKTITGSLIQQEKLSINTRESFIADQCSSSTCNIGKVSPSSSTSLSFPLSSPKIFQTWVSSNVTLNVCGIDAHISICAARKPGILTAVCFVLEKHKLEIVSADISCDESKSLFMIHAQAHICDQFMETFYNYDEIYKQAASEITHWVNSKSS